MLSPILQSLSTCLMTRSRRYHESEGQTPLCLMTRNTQNRSPISCYVRGFSGSPWPSKLRRLRLLSFRHPGSEKVYHRHGQPLQGTAPTSCTGARHHKPKFGSTDASNYASFSPSVGTVGEHGLFLCFAGGRVYLAALQCPVRGINGVLQRAFRRLFNFQIPECMLSVNVLF